MVEFTYQDMFPLGEDATEYRLLSENYVTRATFEWQDILKVSDKGLTYLAEQAFGDSSVGFCSGAATRLGMPS